MKKILPTLLAVWTAILLFLTLLIHFCVEPPPAEEHNWDMIPAVQIEGVLYITTGRANDSDAPAEGTITSQVPGTELPTEDDQSNFGTGYPYRHGEREGTVELFSNDRWWIYATEDTKQELLSPVS